MITLNATFVLQRTRCRTKPPTAALFARNLQRRRCRTKPPKDALSHEASKDALSHEASKGRAVARSLQRTRCRTKPPKDALSHEAGDHSIRQGNKATDCFPVSPKALF
jgi:hypothetical protein